MELARVLDKRKAKKDAEGAPAPSESKKTRKEEGGEKKERAPAKYRQREVAGSTRGGEKGGMDSVLGSVFG